MNAAALLAAAILTPVITSRMKRSTPEPEKAKPENTTWQMRALKSSRLLPGTLILLNLYALHLDMRSSSLTPHAVLRISSDVSVICLCIAMGFMLSICRVLVSMLDLHVELGKATHDLSRVVGNIVTEIARSDDPPQT